MLSKGERDFMGDIVIIGAGFAGLEAARVLSGKRKALGQRRIIVVDAKRTFDFLPVLPDVISGRIPRAHASVDLAAYLENRGVSFENAQVESLDTNAREVRLKSGHVLSFEYVIVAPGSQTNFYGMKDLEKRALKLDSAQDAAMIQNTVCTYPEKCFVIVGGGYTGIELATHIARLLKKRRVKKTRIHVIERQEDILGSLPVWMKNYCRINLCALRVALTTDVSIKESTDAFLKLSNGLEIPDYLLIWAAGVQTPDFVRQLAVPKDRQGRLETDATLQFAPGAFVAGDAASLASRGKPLRMSVLFSLKEGRVAAGNVVRLCLGKKDLKKYRPLDLGFLVPLSNRKACGQVFFLPIRGFIGWVLHYLMCIYRSLTWPCRLGIFADMFLDKRGI